MRLVVIYYFLFCLLVNSTSRGEKARRTFRQLERVVRAQLCLIFMTGTLIVFYWSTPPLIMTLLGKSQRRAFGCYVLQ